MNDSTKEPMIAMETNSIPTTNGSDLSVNVSIEPNHESEIYEIKYDGQEIYKEPISYSDNLAKLINKIDFNEDDESEQKMEKKESAPTEDEIVTAKKFFLNFHERIKLAFDEICVLLDCLTIVKANKLLGIEATKESNDEKPIEVSDKSLNLILKKKNIDRAKNVFKTSLDKMKNDQENSNFKFHFDLYKARQIWRIKKLGPKFICDLSYRTVGCINSLKANAELIKTDLNILSNDPKIQYLSVNIPEELQDYAFIQIQIMKSLKNSVKEKLFDHRFSLFTFDNMSANKNSSWQETLDRTQNAIYCKEIYNQLLREIFESSTSNQLRPIIIGNSIQLMLTMDYDLIISLIHTSEKSAGPLSTPKNYNFDNALLEYYLHCLLKKSFDQNFYHYDQRPITSTFAYNSQVKIAGMAYANMNHEETESLINLPQNINHLLNKNKKVNLLQSIKEKAEHLILRKKVLRILGQVSAKVGEPNIYVQSASWNSSTSTDIIVTISSSYFESVSKSSFYVLIQDSKITVLNRFSSQSIQFTDCVEDLRDYFLDQCCFHQINLIITISKLFGWILLANLFTKEPGEKYMSGIALVYNNKYSKKIAIKVGPVNNIQIFLNRYNQEKENAINEIIDNDEQLQKILKDLNAGWLYSKDKYEQLDILSYPGFTSMQKIELFFADHSTST